MKVNSFADYNQYFTSGLQTQTQTQTQPQVQAQPNPQTENKEMSTETKTLIGLTIAALAAAGIYIATRGKGGTKATQELAEQAVNTNPVKKLVNPLDNFTKMAPDFKKIKEGEDIITILKNDTRRVDKFEKGFYQSKFYGKDGKLRAEVLYDEVKGNAHGITHFNKDGKVIKMITPSGIKENPLNIQKFKYDNTGNLKEEIVNGVSNSIS